MKKSRIIPVLVIYALVTACSLSIPQTQTPGSRWSFVPSVSKVNTEKKAVSVVVAKPWVASGYDTRNVIVTFASGQRDVLADVEWAETYKDWIRNYFIEGLQTSGDFESVSANQKLRSEHRVLQLHVWDLSVHFESLQKTKPVVKAKMAMTISDGRGRKLLNQKLIEFSETVAENRVSAIMAGFESVIDKCFNRVREELLQL